METTGRQVRSHRTQRIVYFLQQDKSSDANKSLVSLKSGSVQHQILYHFFVLSPCTVNSLSCKSK